MFFAPFRLIIRVMQRFRTEHCAQVAASLSFSTLLGLVPLIAVGLALLVHMPFAAGLSAALEKFLLANLLPEKAGIVIARYLGQFAHKAERLTLVGGAWLALTALIQMLTIEHAFNAIWRVKATRPLLRRLVMHFVALLLGPLLFGGSLWAIGYLAGVSLGLLNEPEWLDTLFFRLLPLTSMTAMFALLYHAVPNRNVLKWHAFIGGLFAALGFTLMQRLFGLYVTKFPTYTMIYGAFSAVPIFLAWLYLSWSVVLVGALIVAELPGARQSSKGGARSKKQE